MEVQKLCRLMPGHNEVFTVEKYKHFLNLPYGRINLFLCLSKHFLLITPSDLLDSNNNSDSDVVSACQKNKVEQILPHKTTEQSELPTFLCSSSEEQSSFSFYGSSDLQQVSNIDLFELQPQQSLVNSDRSIAPKIMCPVCQKNFSVEVIEMHADECAEHLKKENIFYLSENEDNYSSDDNQEIICTNNKVCVKDVNSEVQKCGIDFSAAPHVVFVVFRGRCFSDFQRFFSKPWNQSKICHRYIVKFAGEEGIDEGGISREFFTGMLL